MMSHSFEFFLVSQLSYHLLCSEAVVFFFFLEAAQSYNLPNV